MKICAGSTIILSYSYYEYKKPKLTPGNPGLIAQEIFVEQYDKFKNIGSYWDELTSIMSDELELA
jgi:hypothetical protein